MLLLTLKAKKLLERFTKKYCQKKQKKKTTATKKQKKFRMEKVIKRKGDKLNVK